MKEYVDKSVEQNRHLKIDLDKYGHLIFDKGIENM